MRRLVVRVDANTQIGTGHLMRCIALADGLRKKDFPEITFLSKDYDRKILDKIREYDFQVEAIPHQANLNEDLKRLVRMIQKNNKTIVVTDSYDINSHYLKELKNTGVFLICIDDLARIHFPADVVLNQNIYALEMSYSVEAQTELLLGPRYALLRREFLKRHKARRLVKKKVSSILVIMGGSDPHNQTLKVINALKDVDKRASEGLIVYVVVGAGYQNHQQLGTLSNKVNFQVNVMCDPDNLSQLMAEADIAISAGGSTCYELACLGVPNIIVSLAENQKRVAERLDEEGVSIYLDCFRNVNKEDIKRAVEELIADNRKRTEMSEKGKMLIDGRGVERTVKDVKKFIK